MSKHDKQRVGLQRKVSSVFKNVSVPGAKNTGETPSAKEDDKSSLKLPVQKDRVPTTEISEDNRSESSSQKSEATQSPISRPPAAIEKKTESITPQKVSRPVPPVMKKPQTNQTSLLKKLDDSEDSNNDIVSRPSVSKKPEVSEASSDDKTVFKKSPVPTQQSPKSKQASQSSFIQKPATSDDAKKETVSDNKTKATVPSVPKQGSFSNNKLRKESKQEASTASYSQSSNSLADQLANAVEDDGGFLQQIKEKLVPADASTKDKVMIVLVPLLAIAMIFAFKQVLFKSPGEANAAKKEDEKVVVQVKETDEIEWKIPDPLPIMTRDPLQLPQQNNTEPNEQVKTERVTVSTAEKIRTGIINVRDIVYSKDKASALIGSRIVYAGDKIGDVTILKINKDSIEFESNGERWFQSVRD